MEVLTWEDLRPYYSDGVVDKIKASFDRRLAAKEISGQSMGIRSFLSWLSRQNARPLESVQRLFQARSTVAFDELRFPLHSAAKKWASFLEGSTNLNPTTINHYTRRLRWALRALREDYPSDYPKIESGFLRRQDPKSPAAHESLGEQKWADLENLSGTFRERAALNAIRKEALELFGELEKMFWFGQSVISGEGGPPDDVDPQAWFAIQARLRHALTTGSKVRPQSNPQGIPFAALSDPKLWKDAGLDVDVTRRGPLERRGVSKLMDFCMAPTLELCHLAAVIYCCATGWNRQPMFDIASNPYLFSTRDKRGVVTSSFLAELKKRAGHEVTSYLESGRHISPLQINNLKAIIRDAELEFPHFGSGAFEELAADDEALDLLDRFQRIVSHMDYAAIPKSCEGRLFIYKANGKFRLAADSKKPLSYLKLFQRPGLDYPAIRKTVLGLRLRSVGSIDALRVFANHKDTSVLMPHYINGEADKREYSDKIRFVQDSVQALLLEDRQKLVVRLNMSVEEVKYYQRLSKISGIGAAMLPMELEQSKSDETFEFSPSPNYLLTLYLISFSLVRSRLDGLDPIRWLVQGRELLIMTRGIKKALIQSGLGAALREQSRRGFAGLKSGAFSLPILLEG